MEMNKRNYGGGCIEYHGEISEDERNAIYRILQYLRDTEATDYYVTGEPKGHIYLDLLELDELNDRLEEADLTAY